MSFETNLILFIMKRIFLTGGIIIILVVFLACGDNNKRASEESDKRAGIFPEPVEVKVIKIKKGLFENRRYTNGIIKSGRKAIVSFPMSGILLEMRAYNGKSVKKGEIIAILDTTEVAVAIKRARIQLERTHLLFFDNLIARGYDVKNLQKIPSDVLENSKILSGFKEAEINLEEALNNYQKCFVRAPISGIIASMDNEIHGQVIQWKQLCTIVDNSNLQVYFKIFQSDILFVRPTTMVDIISLSDGNACSRAKVGYISPMVDENGMCEVSAKVTLNNCDFLTDGMHVKVSVNTVRKSVLILPKQAVVFKDDKPVVFVVKNGQANWTEVSIGSENDHYYLVESGLEPGDVVVIENNSWLGHNASIKVMDTVAYSY